MDATIDICLATYNGERFLESFYASLAAQTYPNWRLLVRDDCSTDSTRQIIDKMARGDSRIVALADYLGNLGVVQNFAAILGCSAAPYIMLADQDDVWYPQKIADSLNALVALEARDAPHNCPCLVFTDLHVVDEALNVVNESFMRMQRLWGLRQPSFIALLTQNVAPGCAMIMNRALLNLALPIPAESAMHDWWLMLVAAGTGRIGFLAKPTAGYRQHDSNLIGARRFRLYDAPRQLASYRSRLRRAQVQAGAIVRRYANLMKPSDTAAASTLEGLSRLPVGLRQMQACRRGLRKSGLVRYVAFLLFM